MNNATLTPEERDQLIQRYFDGETLGAESSQAERLLKEDPEAAELLATLRTLSDSIKIDVAGALAEEDFSEYWTNIAEGIAQEGVAVTRGPDSIVAEAAAPLAAPPSLFDRLFGWSGLAAAASAAALIAVGVMNVSDPTVSSDVTPLAAVDHTIIVEEIESPSSLVMVQQENSEEPAIIWIVESDEV